MMTQTTLANFPADLAAARSGPSRRDLLRGAGGAMVGTAVLAAAAPTAAVLSATPAAAMSPSAAEGGVEAKDFIVPESYQMLGRLVETWATDPTLIPRDQATLRRTVETAVGKLPERIKYIMVMQEPMDGLMIVLPPSEMVVAGKASVQETSKYPIPSEYSDLILEKPTALSPEDFFYFRVGEYSLNQCR